MYLKRKTKKKYTVVTKGIIDKIISNNINNAKVISKIFNISLVSSRRIINASCNGVWRLKKNIDSPPDGYFLSKNIEKCVESVMFDKGFIKAY